MGVVVVVCRELVGVASELSKRGFLAWWAWFLGVVGVASGLSGRGLWALWAWAVEMWAWPVASLVGVGSGL